MVRYFRAGLLRRRGPYRPGGSWRLDSPGEGSGCVLFDPAASVLATNVAAVAGSARSPDESLGIASATNSRSTSR